jgi:hypothetical protein
MRRPALLAYLLVLTGFAMRVWNLSTSSVWWDEAYTVQTARYGWDTFWQLQTIARHPPLYFLSVRGWNNVAGWSEFSLRFLSVVYGVIGLVLLYKLCAHLFTQRAGVWTLSVAALSPAIVVYSQEGRMYALAFMLACGMLYFAARSMAVHISDQSFRRRDHALFLVFESLLLLTHYFALPFVAALNVLILLRLLRQPARLADYFKWIGGQTLAALPVLAWVAMVGLSQGGLSVANEPRPDLIGFARQVIVLWATSVRDLNNQWTAIFWTSAVLIIFVSMFAALNHRCARLVILFGALALTLAFVFANVITSFHPRYVLMFSIPFFVLLGGALDSGQAYRSRRAMVSGIILIVTAVLLIAGWKIVIDPQYAKDDARGAAAYLRSISQPDDVILVEAHDYTLSYYDHGLASTKMITASIEADAFQQLSQAVGTAKHVWLAHWAVSTQDPRGYWRFVLEQSGRLIDWTSYHGYELYEYEMRSSIIQPVLIDRAPLDFAIAKATAWSGIQDQSEGALAIAIEWRRGDQTSNDARVALRLLDSAGHEINSVNVPLIDETGRPPAAWLLDQPTLNYYVLPIPLGTPPLSYTLDARVYEPKSSPDILSSEQALGDIHLSRRLDASDPYRTLDGYHWQTISTTAVVPRLNLEAFSVAPQMPKSLDQVDVTVRWRKTGSIDTAAPHIRLIQNDRVWVDLDSNLFERDYPIGQWLIGETVIEHRALTYPPIAGEAQLQIGQGESWTTLITLTLNTSALSFAAPIMQHSQSASYNHFTDLVGYDLSADSIALYRPLELTIYWRAMNTEPITTSYTIFTQLIAADGHLVAQQDGLPSPIVNSWVKGQVVVDRHALKVVDPAYRGPATLIVGWYNSATIERVQTITGDDHVTLQTPMQVTEQ